MGREARRWRRITRESELRARGGEHRRQLRLRLGRSTVIGYDGLSSTLRWWKTRLLEGKRPGKWGPDYSKDYL